MVTNESELAALREQLAAVKRERDEWFLRARDKHVAVFVVARALAAIRGTPAGTGPPAREPWAEAKHLPGVIDVVRNVIVEQQAKGASSSLVAAAVVAAISPLLDLSGIEDETAPPPPEALVHGEPGTSAKDSIEFHRVDEDGCCAQCGLDAVVTPEKDEG